MTRINLIDPRYLTDKHLMAEYRELPRVFTHVKKLRHNPVIPEKYCLGKGHVTFFFNKLLWCKLRHRALHDELVRRGFNLDEELYLKIHSQELPKEYWGEMYEPTPGEVYLNMSRLVERWGGQ